MAQATTKDSSGVKNTAPLRTVQIDVPAHCLPSTNTSNGESSPEYLRGINHFNSAPRQARWPRDPTDGLEGKRRLGGSCQVLTGAEVDSVLSDAKAWDHLHEGTSETWASARDFNQTTEPDLSSDEDFWKIQLFKSL